MSRRRLPRRSICSGWRATSRATRRPLFSTGGRVSRHSARWATGSVCRRAWPRLACSRRITGLSSSQPGCTRSRGCAAPARRLEQEATLFPCARDPVLRVVRVAEPGLPRHHATEFMGVGDHASKEGRGRRSGVHRRVLHVPPTTPRNARGVRRPSARRCRVARSRRRDEPARASHSADRTAPGSRTSGSRRGR